MRRLGRSYLEATPEERDGPTLLARLSLRDGIPHFEGRPRQEATWRALKARRDQEFAAGDTVVVDGWLLARTEARLCAVLAQPA